MSDRTGAPNPSRGGSRVILSGLAVGAVLSAPIATAAATGAVEPAAAAVQHVSEPGTCGPGGPGGESVTAAAIREQFRGSFTAGAVSLPTTDVGPVICETS